MLELGADFGLSLFYLLCVGAMGILIYRSYLAERFSFHLIFSGIYFVTFFFGFPFSMALKYGFEISLQRPEILFFTLVTSIASYFIYFLSYRFFRFSGLQAVRFSHFFAKKTAKLTAWLLLFVAVGTIGYFIYLNGLLLFRLEKYSQIFSSQVSAVALKRFFYFFLPALLIFYLISPTKKRWWAFLVLGISFGVLSYLAVGGTRAHLALAVAFFFLLGWWKGYFSAVWLLAASVVAVIVMFFLALARYNLDVQGSEAWFTFLYLSRDTFSPWENFARILASDVEFQGLMPIVRDFYVYIPQSLWLEKPNIVWNTANYFTKTLLDNQSGLAMSPTLLGSFYLMGGFPLIVLGMVLIGQLIGLLDRLFNVAIASGHILIQAYCLANLFNLIILVREGCDAFFSRWAFFSLIFFLCWLISSLIVGKRDG